MVDGPNPTGGDPQNTGDPKGGGPQGQPAGGSGNPGEGAEEALRKLQEAIKTRDQAKARAREYESTIDSLIKAKDGEPLTPE